MSSDWPGQKFAKWEELITDEIMAAGYNVIDVLGEKLSLDTTPQPSVGNMLPLLKIYSAPVSLGPMGETLDVLCRNTFHEWKSFHGATEEEVNKIQTATQTAADRYIKEMEVVEAFLSKYGLCAPPSDLDNERQLISTIKSPARSGDEVQAKAKIILEVFVPEVIEPRLNRLYNLITKLKDKGVPDVVLNGPAAIRKSYMHLIDSDLPCTHSKCRQDAAQNALMTLAVMNWKRKKIPEYLPIIHHQTVARLRNKTLKRLSDAELFIFRHQQTIDDLKVRSPAAL